MKEYRDWVVQKSEKRLKKGVDFKELLDCNSREDCPDEDSMIVNGNIRKAICENDYQFIIALLLEAGEKGVALSSDVLINLAVYLQNKTTKGGKKAKQGRPKEPPYKGSEIAEYYGICLAKSKSKDTEYYNKTAFEIELDICEELEISTRTLNTIMAKNRITKDTAYQIELRLMREQGFSLDKKILEQIKKGSFFTKTNYSYF